MPIDWQAVRYRGDVADVKEMFETYRIGDYLETFEETLRQRDVGLRESLLRDGIRLSEKLSPRIYGIFRAVCQRLEVDASAEVFCVPNASVNAFAALDRRSSQDYYLVGVTSGALESLGDMELCSILGHEMGHILYGNNRLNALISSDKNNPSLTVLPALGEALFLRWRKKAEISADRAGLLASGSFEESAHALMKATFGLSAKNLNLDVSSLVTQIGEIQGRPELMAEAFASHPLLPIRLKALELFAASKKAARSGYPLSEPGLDDDTLEEEVDELLLLTRRYPHNALRENMMKVVAMAGAMVLGADGDVGDDEVKILVQTLHRWFTDEPEREIVTDRMRIASELPALAALIGREGDEADKAFVLSRLAEIALADGALVDVEGSVVLQVAEMLGLPSRAAYNVLVGAAQAVGFRADIKLNRIAERLRRSLQSGLGPMNTELDSGDMVLKPQHDGGGDLDRRADD